MKQCGKCWLNEEPKDDRARAVGLLFCTPLEKHVSPDADAFACRHFLHRDKAISRLRRAL